jgi:hypothetical protein
VEAVQFRFVGLPLAVEFVAVGHGGIVNKKALSDGLLAVARATLPPELRAAVCYIVDADGKTLE